MSHLLPAPLSQGHLMEDMFRSLLVYLSLMIRSEMVNLAGITSGTHMAASGLLWSHDCTQPFPFWSLLVSWAFIDFIYPFWGYFTLQIPKPLGANLVTMSRNTMTSGLLHHRIITVLFLLHNCLKIPLWDVKDRLVPVTMETGAN